MSIRSSLKNLGFFSTTCGAEGTEECRFVLQKFPQYFLVPLQMSLDDGGTSLRGSLLRSVHESVNSGVGFAT